MAELSEGLSQLKIDAASSGDNTIIPAVANTKIRVFRMWFTVRAPVDVVAKDGDSTALTGPLPLSDTTYGLFLKFSEEPWFTTSTGNALILNLSAAIQCSGSVYYKQS